MAFRMAAWASAEYGSAAALSTALSTALTAALTSRWYRSSCGKAGSARKLIPLRSTWTWKSNACTASLTALAFPSLGLERPAGPGAHRSPVPSAVGARLGTAGHAARRIGRRAGELVELRPGFDQ